ncbi:cadmium-translocating P-type ATPase [Sinimarinibacterium sp. CAU 1509]|uniref:heavy metal translocating P-type ATPase n=1 Tax=Sinimarinibacterium sp. CAU 1509 TaxID=2562283 RepID=UPI0010AC91B0|nr:cation-translocating P-type ATPase [Sinimarinibacterium sp. CAU 1509]TJY63004.1 cadmium-translocating P-type ATPase [Sinimarinibacterium sp. CAU 1509]
MTASAYAVYDGDELRDTVSAPVAGGRREVLIGVDGMHCAACVGRIRKLLAEDCADPRISLTSRTLEFRFDPDQTQLSSVLERLDRAGFKPQVLAQDRGLNAMVGERRDALARIGVAVLCAMQVMMLAWPSYTDGGVIDPRIDQLLRWSQWVVATPAVFYAGRPFLRGAWHAISARSLNMDVPVALSILIAYGASVWRTLAGSGETYFDTATMFVMFLLIGRFLESRTRALAGERLRRLAGSRQLTAQRETAAGIETVPISVLQAGERIVVGPGESVPVDGVLLDTAAELDEALLTGESRAVVHHAGERLLAGSLNLGQSPLRLTAEGVGAATWLAQITHLLQRAQTERPRFQILADRLAGVFILAVLVLASAGAALWWHAGIDHALSVALAVLVASCPCALSLAVPAAIAAAGSRLAAIGVLAARPQVLARLPAVDTVLFDKTGTLTMGELSISEVTVQADVERDTCLALAAALERGLTHPIARAFSAVPSRLFALEQIQEVGRGVKGRIDGQDYRLGALAASAPEAQDGSTLVALHRGEQCLATFRLSSTIRPDAEATLDALRAQGIAIELLTGDADAPAQDLARQLGIERVRARQTPEQKLARLRELQSQGHVVLAVGDGINDAPFLAAADVSCAMPRGAALTQSRADLLLVGDSLAALAPARRIATLADRRVRQNIAWAVIYNLAVLPLALGGVLLPWMAALGMSLSSLLVVGNALRLGAADRVLGSVSHSGESPLTEVCA